MTYEHTRLARLRHRDPGKRRLRVEHVRAAMVVVLNTEDMRSYRLGVRLLAEWIGVA